jgi:hypothetical protein
MVAATSGSNTTSAKTVTATCAAGKSVVGAGFTTIGITGAHVLQDGPDSATSWTVRVTENQGGTPTWTLTVTAICVTALP